MIQGNCLIYVKFDNFDDFDRRLIIIFQNVGSACFRNVVFVVSND